MAGKTLLPTLGAFALGIAGLGSAHAAPLELTYADGQLTIRTERYEVQWQQGCLTAARTLLPCRRR